MQSAGAKITARRRHRNRRHFPPAKTSRADNTTTGAEKNIARAKHRNSRPSLRRADNAPASAVASVVASGGENFTAQTADFPRRKPWEKIAAPVRQTIAAEIATRAHAGSAIIAQVPASAAAPTTTKTAAADNDGPKRKANCGAAATDNGTTTGDSGTDSRTRSF